MLCFLRLFVCDALLSSLFQPRFVFGTKTARINQGIRTKTTKQGLPTLVSLFFLSLGTSVAIKEQSPSFWFILFVSQSDSYYFFVPTEPNQRALFFNRYACPKR
jgi:hypothetical protein